MHVIIDAQERRNIETRRTRMEKDREYEQSLPADQEKERALQQEEMKNIVCVYHQLLPAAAFVSFANTETTCSSG
jgi:hypothetical protein